MSLSTANDLDFLAARLHGRRSRMAEGAPLDRLCRLRTPADLARALYPKDDFRAPADLQRRLVRDLERELAALRRHLAGEEAEFLEWMRARFELEELKVLLRGLWTHATPETLEPLLLHPGRFAAAMPALLAARTPEELAERTPDGALRRILKAALAAHPPPAPTFFVEAALDRGYLRELLARAKAIPEADRPEVLALARQEANIFHLMLAARGHFLHGLDAGQLRPLHIAGGGGGAAEFDALLGAPNLAAAAARLVGRAIDALPARAPAAPDAAEAPEASAYEALAWNRYARLANRAFRRSPIGFGAVAGYVGLRRIEVANLITLSEGLRAQLPADALRARMIPRDV